MVGIVMLMTVVVMIPVIVRAIVIVVLTIRKSAHVVAIALMITTAIAMVACEMVVWRVMAIRMIMVVMVVVMVVVLSSGCCLRRCQYARVWKCLRINELGSQRIPEFESA